MPAKPKAAPTPDAGAKPAVRDSIVQTAKTGLRRAWGLITVKVDISPEKPAGTQWASWNLPVLETRYYIVITVGIIGTTLLHGFVELY